MDPDKRLSREEFDDVMRRAAELAASDPDDADEGIPEGEVLRIAREVGLSERHVRRALTEVRSGPVPAGGFLDRIYGSTVVRASRVVPGARKELARKLDEFLVGGQLLEPVRRTPGHLQYRPSVDWMSQVARAASSMSKRYYVASAKDVEVGLEEVESSEDGDPRTLVELRVDAGIRDDYVAGGTLGGGGVGVAGGVAVALGLETLVPLTLAVPAGVAVGAVLLAGGVWISTRYHRKRLVEVHTEVEGILDKLETGRSLKPPPPSWQRWVKRHFHGAREMLTGLGTEEEYDEMDNEF